MTGALEVSSLVAQTLPSLRRAILIGRGGAAVLAAQSLSDSVSEKVTTLSGGATNNNVTPVREKLFGISVTPEAKAAFYTAIAMAFHYWGYSIARPVTVSLFTSASTGYMGAGWAFPFAMAFVSPMSLLLLMGYSGLLDKSGPRAALTYSTTFCASIISLAAIGIGISEETGFKIASIAGSKFISGPLFVFREAYVQLLTSQYWSFMASILTPSQSAKWFGPIAGLTSIASATAGVAVFPLVKKVGLAGAMLATAAMLFMSLIFSTLAYNTSDKYGFTPTDLKKKKHPVVANNRKSSLTNKNEPDIHNASMFVKATKLFSRVPLLWALFLEILASQGLATILNVIFVSRLETAIPNDSERAGFVGMFFSLINVITMILQIVILPPIVAILEPRYIWRALPLISLLFTGFQTSQKDPSLYIVSASLLVMKVTEYSARRMLDEMVYVPLDFESRFLGKEVIGVFGYRFGKSLMSLAISGITQLVGNANFDLQQKSYLGTAVALGWMQAAWRLSNYVPTRAEAEEAYKKQKGKKK